MLLIFQYIKSLIMICFYNFINKKHSIYLLVYFLMLKFAGVIIYTIKYVFE